LTATARAKKAGAARTAKQAATKSQR